MSQNCSNYNGSTGNRRLQTNLTHILIGSVLPTALQNVVDFMHDLELFECEVYPVQIRRLWALSWFLTE